MAYDLSARFPPTPKYFTLLDPGSYYSDKSRNKQNAAPFLSKTPRKTLGGATLWTQAVYDQSLPSNIPNCSSMLSKKPRFPYEAFSAEDLEEMLCKCGIITCECPTGQDTEEEIVLCQGKVKRRLFKGTVLQSLYGSGGLSTSAGKKQESPPFYDARVNESTAFYQGCKWSKRTAKDRKDKEVRPGPTHYSLERDPTEFEICAEKVRAFKRKTTRQLRFIEMVQQRTILENRPSPAAYDPKLPKGTDLKFLGPKSERFPMGQYDIHPGPADHWLRRDFDAIEPPDIVCQAKLPEPACFGLKAKRFKTQREEGPSPASYTINNLKTNFDGCRTPFGSSAERFKTETIEESDNDEIVEPSVEESKATPCERPTWEFKSKTIRMKPLLKKYNEASPADFLQKKSPVKKNAVPFSSSERRFMPWYTWLSVHGFLETPGPGYYSTEKPKCFPAFKRGPLYRAPRFPNICHKSPPPNAYQVNNGIETILATHNTRLKSNLKDQFEIKYHREEPRVMTYEKRERILFDKCIACLDTEPEEKEETEPLEQDVPVTPKSKLLKHFLYAHPVPNIL